MTREQRAPDGAAATPDDAAGSPTGITPAAPAERIVSLDFIRGFAVLGILAANIVAFGQPMGAYMWPDAFLTEHGPVSDWLWVVQFVAVDGKMRGLFTLLFGAGLALFADKAALADKAGQGGASGHGLQARRLGWLLAFGLVHFFLIWRGDILTLYALLGFAALPFLHWPAQRLLVLGLIGYAAGALLYGASMVTPFLIADTALGDGPGMAETRAGLEAAVADVVAEDAVEARILTEGTYADFVAHNFAEHAGDPLDSALLLGLETLPLMLIGMALYRLGLFSGGFAPGRQRAWGWAGVIAGSLLTLGVALWIRATGFTYWGTLAAFLSLSLLPRLPMIIGLAALLALCGGRGGGGEQGWLGRRLSAAGRMAFSNYLGTSLLMMLVFHPWAGGLWGELTRPQLYLVAVLGWVVMLAWSAPWLARFRFGPLEWLWRCLTYMRLFPLRGAQTEARRNTQT